MRTSTWWSYDLPPRSNFVMLYNTVKTSILRGSECSKARSNLPSRKPCRQRMKSWRLFLILPRRPFLAKTSEPRMAYHRHWKYSKTPEDRSSAILEFASWRSSCSHADRAELLSIHSFRDFLWSLEYCSCLITDMIPWICSQKLEFGFRIDGWNCVYTALPIQ